MNPLMILKEILTTGYKSNGVSISSDSVISPIITYADGRLILKFDKNDIKISITKIITIATELDYLAFDINKDIMYIKAKIIPMEIPVNLKEL